ncbi:MAG: extracellular solute-binding protein [Spirochaetales bacterium]|nr:extracellular solute-binding protein [Spirochaetales bacterium]
MKNTFLFLAASFMILPGLLFASGRDEEPADINTITLEFWTHEDLNRDAIENRYAEEFMAANPDVIINRITYSSEKIFDLVLTAFAANAGPDIFNMQIEQAYSYIINRRVAPVDYAAAGYTDADDMTAQYIDGFLDSVIAEGDIYGIPLELNNWAIYLNKRVFTDAGLDAEKDYPRTWEEVADISEILTLRDGQTITRRGFDFRYPYYLISIIPMVEQLGGQLVSDDGQTAIIGDDAWINFLTYMQDWGPSGRNLGSPTYKNGRKLFNMDDNEIGMCLSGLYQAARIRSDNPEFYESGDWMVVPFPSFENAVKDVASSYYGQYYMVNAQNTDKDIKMAWKFISYMMSHDEEYLQSVNIVPPTIKLMESDTFRNTPYSDIFVNDLARAEVVYTAENGAEMEELLRDAVESVMLSGISPVQAHAILKAKAQELLNDF